jgi:predicted RecA/RadA family phage recombinase
MANNFRFSGKRVTLTGIANPVAAGALCRVSGWIGIPLVNAVGGQTISFAVEGVWGLTFAAYGGMGTAIPAGSILYWDVVNAALSIGCGANDYPAVKLTTAVSATDGSFEGLLCTGFDRPKTADQS